MNLSVMLQEIFQWNAGVYRNICTDAGLFPAVGIGDMLWKNVEDYCASVAFQRIHFNYEEPR